MVDSKDTTVYLIRHAEADGNFYGRVHGRYNGLLTARGKLQVERLAPKVSTRSY